MKAFSLHRFTSVWIITLSLLVLAGCGSDSNPINPNATNANVNQVNAVNNAVPSNVFSATLTGSEQVPPVNTAATATGVVIVDPSTRLMKATIVTADITGTAAHVHLAPRGVAGPVVFTLTENGAGSGIWSTSAIISVEQLNELRAGNYYFNVHSAAFPDGEIRGQILVQLPKSGSAIPATGTSVSTTATGTGTSGSAASGASTDSGAGVTSTGSGTVTNTVNGSSGASGTTGTTATTSTTAATRPLFYTNVLSGSLVVPPTSSAATASAITVYRPRDRVLTSVILSSGLTGTGANLRQAAAGAVGPVVNRLQETTAGSGIWTAHTVLTSAEGSALLGGKMYYEILSATFPSGELRGQIVTTSGTTRTESTSISTGPGTTTTPISKTGAATGATATPISTGTPMTTSSTATGTTSGSSTISSTGTGTTPTASTTVTPITTLTGTGSTTPYSTGVVNP